MAPSGARSGSRLALDFAGDPLAQRGGELALDLGADLPGGERSLERGFARADARVDQSAGGLSGRRGGDLREAATGAQIGAHLRGADTEVAGGLGQAAVAGSPFELGRQPSAQAREPRALARGGQLV